MKKTLITATAVATVMSASAAYAELSLGGALARSIVTGDGTKGITNTSTSSTINVDYTTTLDNGMGMAANADITPSGTVYLLTMSSSMGSFFTGADFASAMDSYDGAQGAGTYGGGGRILSSTNSAYNDGDANSGNGFGISTSLAGASVQVTMGDNSHASQTNERVMSIAASYNLAGISLKGGNTDFGDANDHSFMSAGYSVGGFGLGYNVYDSNTETVTQVGASTSIGGMGVGVSFAEADNSGSTADSDAMGIHVNGSLGGAFWYVDYVNTDDGAGTETDKFTITYGVGF